MKAGALNRIFDKRSVRVILPFNTIVIRVIDPAIFNCWTLARDHFDSIVSRIFYYAIAQQDIAAVLYLNTRHSLKLKVKVLDRYEINIHHIESCIGDADFDFMVDWFFITLPKKKNLLQRFIKEPFSP